MTQADAGRLLFKFVATIQQTDADDPFLQWLRDKKPVRIDWSTFGIEKLQSTPPQ